MRLPIQMRRRPGSHGFKDIKGREESSDVLRSVQVVCHPSGCAATTSNCFYFTDVDNMVPKYASIGSLQVLETNNESCWVFVV